MAKMSKLLAALLHLEREDPDKRSVFVKIGLNEELYTITQINEVEAGVIIQAEKRTDDTSG